MRKFLMSMVALAAFYAPSAFADSIQLQCTTTCTAGSTSLVSGGTSVSFNFVDVANQTITGDAFIAILVPTGGLTPTLTGGILQESKSFTTSDLGTALGEAFSDYNLSTFQSASGQVGISPAGYTAYEYSVGTGVTLGPSGIGVTGLSATADAGSVIVGYIESSGTTYQTPMSESITNGITVPEPSSLMLLAVGLFGVLALAGKKLIAA